MTRILATAAILVGLSFSAILVGLSFWISPPAHSEPQRNLVSDNGCFPWQLIRNGQCVTKDTPAVPPPLPPEPAGEPSRALAALPVASPLPSENITRRPELTVICNGGTVTNRACTCPSGYRVMASDNEAGGTCVRSNAENCLGGELTVGGKCLCHRQVTMSGEIYLLEYARGKCLPMRCPVTELKDGKCTTSPTLQSTGAEPKKYPTRLRHAMVGRWRM